MTITEINVQTGEKKQRDWTPNEIKKHEEGRAESKSRLTYADKRLREYPDIGDQLDAILKSFDQMRSNGTDFPEDLDNLISQWLDVKNKYPKQ